MQPCWSAIDQEETAMTRQEFKALEASLAEQAIRRAVEATEERPFPFSPITPSRAARRTMTLGWASISRNRIGV